MSVLIGEYEERGIEMPGKKQGNPNANASQQRSYNHQEEGSSFSVGTLLLGVVFIIGGVAASAGTGRIFYGAVIVGVVMVFKSFFKTD